MAANVFDDLIPEKAPIGAFDDLIPAGEFDDLIPSPGETSGTLAGIAGSVRRGVKGAQAIFPTIEAMGAAGGSPTMRQERKAFERAMTDPRYGLELVEAEFSGDPGKARNVEQLYGAPQKLRELRAPAEDRRAIWAGVAAEFAAEREAIPKSQAQAEFGQAQTQAEKWAVWRKYPVQVTSSIALESLPPAIAGALIGTATLGPGAGTGIGVGASSFATELSNSFLSSATEQGYDVTDADSLQKFLETPEQWRKAMDTAVTRAAVIGGIDGPTAGLAGRFIGPALQQGLWQAVRASGKEVTMQMAAGAGGELAAQALTKEGKPFDWFDIAMEGFAEAAGAPAEVLSNVRAAGKQASREAGERITKLQAPAPELEAASLEQALRQADAQAESRAAPPVQTSASGVPGGTPSPAPGTAALPAEPETTTTIADRKSYPVIEVPVGELSLSQDVPNFKADADVETGVVQGQQLEGAYERLGTGAVTVWERQDGRREVISGRHRFDLARRTGEKTIPAQVVREADGFTKEMAMTLDAEMNIRDGQGTVSDYANYFRNTEVTEEAARARGLLSRAKGQAGWALGKNASTDLYALYRAGKVSEAQAVAIAQAAPTSVGATAAEAAALQRVGSKAAIRGAGPQELHNFIQAMRYKTRNAPAEQLDLFGANDAAVNEAERLAKVAAKLQRELDKEIKATDNAVRNAEMAKSKGLRFERDPQEILGENARLRVLRKQWDNWALHPELAEQVLAAGGMDRVEQALDSLKFRIDRSQLHALGIVPEVWNGLIETVRIAYRGGKRLIEAIEDGLAWLRERHAAVDEQRLRVLLGASVTDPLPMEPDASWQQSNEVNHARAEQIGREFQGRTVRNQDTGWQILFNREGIDRTLLEARTPAHFQSITVLPQLVERAVHVDTRPDERGREHIKARHTLATRLKAANRLFAVKITVEELADGRRFYDHELIEEEAPAGNTVFNGPNPQRDTPAAGESNISGGGGEVNERAFTQKVLDPGSGVSADVKQALPETAILYRPRSNETDAQAAHRIILEQGVDNAIAAFKDKDTGVPGAVRTALGLALIKRLGQMEQGAALSGNRIAEQEAITKQVDLVEHVTTRATEIAQSLQAMSMWARMTPAGHLKAARRVIETAANTVLARLRPVLEEMKDVVESVNSSTAAAVVTTTEVARAVDGIAGDAVVRSRDVHNTIVIEVAGALGSSPEVLRLLRERVRAFLSEDQKRQVINQLQTILARHYIGADGRTLAQKIGVLGLENETAQSLAEKIDAEFSRQVTQRNAEVKEKVKRARAERKPLGLLAADSELDQAIRRELKRLDLRLATIVNWHYTRVDDLKQSLAQRLSEGLGLSEDGAAFLAARIEARFAQLATERKRAALGKLPKPTSVAGKAARRPEVINRLIEMSNLGAFTEEQFYNAVKQRLGLPVFTPEIAAEITRRTNAIRKLPEGFQQQRAQIELMGYIEKQKGIHWYDLALPFWFANVLSGPATHLVNIISNAFNLAAHTALEVLKRPLATPQIIEALARGAGRGLLEGAAVLKTGLRTGGPELQKIRAGRTLEVYDFKGWATPLKAWRYVWRAMAAEDMVFLKAGEEMRQAVAARVIAKSEGIRERAELTRRAAGILGNTKAARIAATARARAEGLKGLDFRRRVNELIEQGRSEEMRENALEYAVKVTFNNEPYGVLGVIARGVQSVVNEQPALRLIVPFIKIVANVTNESLNYLPPVGLGRAFYGTWFGKLDGKAIADREQLYDQYAKATIGLLAMGGVAALAAKYSDDDDPPFAVTGAGPRTNEQRNQLRQRGWIPYSVKIGSRYYSYATTPLAVPMAILGNYLDALKYKRLDEVDALNRVAYAFLLSGGVITQQSFLNSVADVFQMLGRDPTKSAGQTGTRLGARIGAGFVVPNLFRQVDQIFDPAVYSDRGIQAALVNQVPFARRLNQPTLNALGEPVEKYVSSRFTSAGRADELWRVLSEKQAWVPVVDRETIVGDRKRGEDYFRMLTPDEVYELTEISGQAIRERLEVNIDRLSFMEPVQAKAFVQKVAEEERRKAKRLFR